MSNLAAAPSPSQLPAARQNARLHLQSRALKGLGGSIGDALIEKAWSRTSPICSP